jgi:glycerol-3-phosphate dehydrogenase
LNDRETNLRELADAPLDVLIIGGGINGAGIARDLSLRASEAGRAMRIGLIERRHFASGTSGRNSQLIHGGLRYLKYFEFGLVREALHERATLLRIAPHLVEPLSFVLPFYSWFDRRFYGIGLWLYDLLAGDQRIGRQRILARKDVREIEPGLAADGLHSAAVFHDCRVNSARLTLENLQDAASHGLLAANYVDAAAWRPDGDGFAVDAADRLTGRTLQLRARRIVDARGPWETGGNVRLVRGSHIVLPRLTQGDHAIAYFGPDGRIVFVIPWGSKNDRSLVGTTDEDHRGSPDDVRISPEEVSYLMNAVRRLFPRSEAAPPLAAYSALRPLIVEQGKSATAASRSHRIWMEGGVVKLAGGKYTTYRSMAQQAVDLLMPEWERLCSTADRVLPDPAAAIEAAGGIVPWAVHQEMAQRLPDVMFVSTYRGHERTWTAEELMPIACQMAGLLGWDERRIREEIDLTLEIARMPKE